MKAKKTRSGAKSICVIAGKDEFLVANRCEELLAGLLTDEQRAMCLYQPKADEVAVTDVLDELRTLPFLADRRVVLIKTGDKLVAAERLIAEDDQPEGAPTAGEAAEPSIEEKRKETKRKKKKPD